MKRKPGETVQELAARIRQAAATCDFANIENPWMKPYELALFVQSIMKQC